LKNSVDLVVTHPHQNKLGGGVLGQQAAAQAAEAGKVYSYGKDFVITDKFIPFGIETAGAWGPSAVSFVRSLAHSKYGSDKKQLVSKFTRDLAVRVSVALQREVGSQLINFQRVVDEAVGHTPVHA
jgi:hypothetical protein